jgi:hypothetical protein
MTHEEAIAEAKTQASVRSGCQLDRDLAGRSVDGGPHRRGPNEVHRGRRPSLRRLRLATIHIPRSNAPLGSPPGVAELRGGVAPPRSGAVTVDVDRACRFGLAPAAFSGQIRAPETARLERLQRSGSRLTALLLQRDKAAVVAVSRPWGPVDHIAPRDSRVRPAGARPLAVAGPARSDHCRDHGPRQGLSWDRGRPGSSASSRRRRRRPRTSWTGIRSADSHTHRRSRTS